MVESRLPKGADLVKLLISPVELSQESVSV